MAEKKGNIAAIQGRRTLVEVSKDGSTYSILPGVNSVSPAIEARESTTINAFEGDTTVLGAAPIGDITMEVTGYLPNHETWKTVFDAYTSGTSLTFRWTTEEDVRFSSPTGAANTVAIAADGVVTFAGSKPDFTGNLFARGMAIVVGGKAYTIISISDAATPEVKVARPTAAVTASQDYKIVVPSLRWVTAAAVKQPPAGELGSGADAALSGSLVITPAGQLALPTVVIA